MDVGSGAVVVVVVVAGRRRAGAAVDPDDEQAAVTTTAPTTAASRRRRGRTGGTAHPCTAIRRLPGTPGRPRYVARMDLLIGGTSRPAADGGTLDVVEPASGTVLTTIASGTAADADAAISAARSAFDAGDVVRSQRHRPRQGAAAGGGAHPGARRGSRDARSAQRRQADRRRALGDQRRGRRVRVLRRRCEQAVRRGGPGAGQRPRRRPARAGRRVRADRAVELPDAHHHVEDRARARVRQLRHHQARVAHTALRAPTRRAAGGGGRSRGVRLGGPRARAASWATRW